jgi:hypothetical protein
MTPVILLQNTFFAFWYFFQDYFFAIWGFALFVSIVVAIIQLIARR